MITYDEFEKVDIRVGRVVSAEHFLEARKPAYKLTIDFGPEIGQKRSSVQITENYTLEELPGKLVMGVVNFPSKQIGPFLSESLTLGCADEHGKVVLVQPERVVPIGNKLF
ncbi:MAG: tRNA-binding protein [bacterium]